jgi:hypothetical protein
MAEPWETPDDFEARYKQNAPQPPAQLPSKSDNTINWVLIVALFAMGLWPVALILLLKLLGGRPIAWTQLLGIRHSRTTGQTRPVTTTKAVAKSQKKQDKRSTRALVNLKNSKRLKIWGGILSAIGAFASWEVFWDSLYYSNIRWMLEDLAFPVGILAIGLALLGSGIARARKANRFDHYLRLIGKNQRITVRTLAEAMPASQKAVCDDLQEMIARGYFDAAYLDVGHGVLVLSDEGIREEAPKPAAVEPAPAPEPAAPVSEENEFLARIRAANDAIAHPVLSEKIDRIEELTRKIFTLLEEHPEKEAELRSFTNYYLPQTLKILDAYGKLEAQGVEGENITQAKQRIEAMMDKLVEGYAQQLDRLFSADVLDITAEISVMESMLAKDGLTKEGVLRPEK